jgi:hypothetical protein
MWGAAPCAPVEQHWHFSGGRSPSPPFFFSPKIPFSLLSSLLERPLRFCVPFRFFSSQPTQTCRQSMITK